MTKHLLRVAIGFEGRVSKQDGERVLAAIRKALPSATITLENGYMMIQPEEISWPDGDPTTPQRRVRTKPKGPAPAYAGV